MPKQERGEHSRENDEKPLKKARYVWEIKGKYHLKESQQNNNTIQTNNNTIEPHLSETKSSKQGIKEWDETANSIDMPCGSSKCCIQSFLAKTEALMDSDIEDEDPFNNNSMEGSISNEIPLTLVSAKPRNQEYYLQKWQAKQMARGFVDNTINNVLESWLNPPQDAADFVDSCAEDGQVEDDAIMMAIQSHGLQSGSLQSGSLQSGSLQRALQIQESNRDNFENSQNELIREHETNSIWANTISCQSSMEQNNLDGDNPMDFLNAAVLVAIQKKGLSYN